MLELYPRIELNESVVCAELDGEMVLLNVETGIYFGLDEVGSEIWKLLVDGEREGTIVDKLVEKYDAPAECIRADVATFLELLVSKGLLQVERN